MALYDYTVQGTAANNQTWIVKGIVECDFSDAFNVAISHTFESLTQGLAQYGKPGVGCNGPYKVIRVLIKRKRDNDKETQMAH